MERQNKIWIGIDPGAAGCISVLRDNKIERYPLEDYNAADVLKQFRCKATCTIEEPECFGRNSNPKTLLVLGKNYGYLTGIMEAYSIRYLPVSPSKWKRYYKLSGKPKEASISVVENMFPDVDLYRTPKCTKKHDGIADSILIMLYGKNMLETTNNMEKSA